MTFEILDGNIAEVDQNGKITAKSEGATKIAVIDSKNRLKTYIYLEVRNTPKIDIQEGKNFTVALKQNGTVWSYGVGANGELGNGKNEQQVEPVQVKGLSNIQAIATGYSHSLAISENRRSICMGTWNKSDNWEMAIRKIAIFQ
ncbi:MAG: hypothetical protein HFJ51_05170 [Clostridia bacterium]|nr:hypothetical protein [Clostridia bacterium]